MKALAIKNTVNESLTGGHKTAKPLQTPVSTLASLPGAIPYVQRKPLCACDGGCPRCTGVIQPQLTIGQPNDKYEQEADRVADQVMRMPEPAVQRKGCSSCSDKEGEEQIQTKPLAEQITPLVQLQEDTDIEEEEKEAVQAKLTDNNRLQRQEEEADEEEKELGQSKSLNNKALLVNNGLHNKIQSLKGGGQPLPATARAFFEPRFGRNFSSVRVHADSHVAGLARSLNAKAFTTGENIIFGSGQYSPDSAHGKKLMAHELTHVLQQTSSNSLKTPGLSLQHRNPPPRLIWCGQRRINMPCATLSYGRRGCIGARNSYVFHPDCGNENCSTSPPSNRRNYIRHILVDRSSYSATITWQGRRLAGRRSISITPNLTSPPRGTYRIGLKCTKFHTNRCGSGMGYFTGFYRGLVIGFHNSQTLGHGIQSHGCVRCDCANAQMIRDHTWSGRTQVEVR